MEKWMVIVIRLLLEKISPVVAEIIKTSLEEAKKKAAETANPWDDIFVEILIFLTGGK